jgi:two-component system, sensor histidine kinase and response regulator
VSVRPAYLPARLLAESLAIVGLTIAAAGALLPTLAPLPQLMPALGALLVVLLAAPPLYWRAMQTVRAAALPAPAPATPMAVAIERLERRRLRAILTTAAAYFCGVTLTGLAGWYVHAQVGTDAQLRFDRLVERLDVEVQRRFHDPIHGLRGLRAHTVLSASMSGASLRSYAEARNFMAEFRGVQGVGFGERLGPAGLQGTGPGHRYVVQSIEPGAGNHGLVGLDLASDPGRRAAVERAIDSGELTLLDHGPAVSAGRAEGFLLVLPMYRDRQAGTPPARRASLIGLALALVRSDELLGGVAAALDDAVEFDLYPADGRASAPGGGTTAEPTSDVRTPARWETTRSLAIAGRPFTLQVRSTPAFEAALARGPLTGVVLGGALLSTLLALVVWALASARVRAQTFAEQMTADLDRLAQVVKHTDNAVLITDPAQRITWVNEGFTRVSGYALPEARGRTPGELLGSGKADPLVLQQLADCAARAEPCRVEVLNRAKDGREYWIDTEVQPLFDAGGELTGFMQIGRDITEQRRAAERLQSALRENSSLMDVIDQHALVSVCDGNGRITHVNDAFCRVSGYAREELIGRSHRFVDGAVESRSFWEPVWAAAASGRAWRGEVRNLAKDGAIYWVDTTIAPMLDAAGRPERFITIRSDITVSKQAAAELALERERLQQANLLLQAILDNLPCGLSVFDARLNLLVATPQFRTLLDLPGALFENPPVSFERLARFNAERGEYGPGEVEDIVARVVERARQPVAHSFERRRGDLTLEVRGVPLPGGGLVTTYTDITERKHFEAVLAASEHMMRLVTDNIPGRLAYFDRDRGLTFANKAMFHALGGNPMQHVGRSFDELLGPDHGDHGRRAARALAGEAHSFDVEGRDASGATAYAIVHLVPDLRDGAVHGFIAMAADVTHVKRAEREMQRAEALLRGAIDAVDEAFVLFDAEDRLVFCNDKYREIYASSADLLVPGNTFEHIVRSGAERGQYAEAVGRVDAWVAERLEAHRRSDLSLVQRLDNGRWLRVVERRMADGHIVGFRIDISDLMNANAAAEAASQAKSRFVANMSHEIRTPMNAVLGMLTLLHRTELNPRQLDYADKAEGAARALLSLLNDILDFSKVEAGKLELDPRAFSLDQMLRDLSVVLAANLGDKPLEVLFDLDPALPAMVVGDDLRLRQVLVNLAGNAVKFTERGEVVVSVRQRARRGGVVRLEVAVSDTGIGIAPEHQQHLFSAFSQAETSTTRRFGGTGLGLAICHRLVLLMGGEITLQSEPGRGSRFSFEIELPVAVQAPAAAESSLRALVVDDNAVARELVSAMAASLGWQVDVACSGARAIECVDAAHHAGADYEAILVDWQMPGLDGWQTSRLIRERLRPERVAPLVMMVTAQGREKLAQRPAEEQALLDGFLVKPVTASMLRDAVAAARANTGPVQALPATRTRRLAGMRLLVVEDNLINQQVAAELLADEGATVQLAGDGEQGVAAVAAADPPFDAVLMDMQMPVMDGHAAAAAIRQRLGLAGLPIIAMTANTLPGDREQNLAAGMNDHVGKPFDLDELVGALLKHAGSRAAAPAQVCRPAAAPAPLSEAVLFHAEALGIGLQAAVDRLAGKTAVWVRSGRSFAQEMPEHLASLDQLLVRGQLEDAARLMHTIKGVAALLGVAPLAAWATGAEARLRLGAAGDIAALPAEMSRELDRAQLALQQLSSMLDGDTPTGAPRDARALGTALDALAPLLAQADMAATDLFADLQAAHDEAWGAELQPLADAMAALDFDAALAGCTALSAALRAG